MTPNSQYLKRNPPDGRMILNVWWGYVYSRKNLAYAICEGFNKEIFMVYEYKCIRCFISKNIGEEEAGREGIIQLVWENISVFCPH